jgi:hypothetical protein
MTSRIINNLLLIFIILCSTSFYNFSALGGSGQKAADLAGIAVIIVLLILHAVYGEKNTIRRNYTPFIGIIFISFFTAMFTAAYTRDQTISQSIFAQRALIYYLLYFLLHQMRIRPSDLQKIIIVFGVIHGLLFLLQYFAYPKILFDTFILIGRGTIRIYLAGSDYLAICFFMFGIAFLQTTRLKYLLFMLLSFSIFVLLGGRQTMALMALVMVIAILLAKKVRSRIGISLIAVAGVVLIFLIFQPIFQGMLQESKSNQAQGMEYVRFRAAAYFLTDFYKTKIAYITGNGAPFNTSTYGRLIETIKLSNAFFLGDIGIIGSYVLYGIFFVIGAFGIIFKTLLLKFEGNYLYIKYVFIGFALSLITGSGFEKADFICALCMLLYIVDVNQPQKKNEIIV